jgi:acetolactate synthase I/II/III large subunit
MIRVADYIMQRLSGAGVSHVFQVTGRGALFLSDALAKHTELHAISLHHEQSCAFAAVGYAEQTDGLGACLVSTGCAATNAMTGVLSAWQDAVPCIFISGQNILRETSRFTGIPLRTFGQQEADIIGLVTPITKYAHMLTKPTDIVEVMDQAIDAAMTGRMGPVWLDIPLDLQSSLIEPEEISRQKNNSFSKLQIEASDIDISVVIQSLEKAERPVILIGRGVHSSGADQQLKEFVERWQIPLTFTASAPDTYGSKNLLSIGSVGAMGCSRAGNFAVANADFVLVLGSRLTPLSTGPDFCKFARSARVIVIDIDDIEHTKNSIRIDHFIQSDIKFFLKNINQHLKFNVRHSWVEKCQHWKRVFKDIEPDFKSTDLVDLYQLADRLSNIMPTPSTLVTDSGLAEVILPSNIHFSDGIRCVHPASQGAMGFALPASIGAQHATDNPVLAVIGDGSIMMNLQELQSISYQQLPIKIIVINNNVYSIIRRRQRDLFRKRTIGTDPENGVSCPNFSKVADCFGLKYLRISTIDELDEGLKNLFSMEGPVLCEIMGRVDQSYIEIGHARSAINRRIVRRPLEDQEPFLPREVFLSEMIIEPIDQ